MKMRKMLALLTVALLMLQLPMSALAATYVLTDGSVYISNDETGKGQVVSRDKLTWTADETPIIITSNGEATSNTIEVTTTGESISITLRDVNIAVSNKAPVEVNRADGTTVTVELDGTNNLSSGAWNHAGLQTEGEGTLVIEDANGDGGSLTAQGGINAAGIGGGTQSNGENIVINSGEITAYGGSYGAGIGGGIAAAGNNIVINGGVVEAYGGDVAAGIGGGGTGDASNIEINGGVVKAESNFGASGIGSGAGGYASGISVSGDAKVTAIGDTVNGAANIGNGAMTDESSEPIPENQLNEDGSWKDNVDTSGLYNTGSLTLGEGENAETVVGLIPDPNVQLSAPAAVVYVEASYGGPGSWSATSHEVDEAFWQDVLEQLRNAEKGKAVLINVGDRKVMPAYIMEAIRETGITLIIQWDGGADIIIEEAYPYKDAYQVYWIQNLNKILSSV